MRNHIGDIEGKIKAFDVWEILNLRGAQLTQDAYQRSSEAMKRLGWKRPNKAGTASFKGQMMAAFVRGNPRWAVIVERDQYGLHVVSEKEIEEQKAEKQRKYEELERAAEERAKKAEQERKAYTAARKAQERAKKVAAKKKR